jgi:hypothetical protein
MGSVIEHLHVPSFPTYCLVSGDTVVFRANANDPEAVSLLEAEIRGHLRKE